MTFPDLSQKNVLIVEDDDMSYLYLTQLFKLTHCQYFRAKTGIEAWEIFRQQQLHLILMDIQLPDMDGTQITREIRKLDPHIPIIAQTAGKSSEEMDKAWQSGCSDLIIKPFSMETLFASISRFGL